MYSSYGKWKEVMKVTNTLFGKEVFNQEQRWLEAGCLFVALSQYRAKLELDRGEPFPNEWMNGRFLSPVKAYHYLGFARRCFNSGFKYPARVEIPPQLWMDCQSDLQVCISQAETARAEALEVYSSSGTRLQWMKGLGSKVL